MGRVIGGESISRRLNDLELKGKYCNRNSVPSISIGQISDRVLRYRLLSPRNPPERESVWQLQLLELPESPVLLIVIEVNR